MLPSFVHRSEAFAEDLAEVDAPAATPTPPRAPLAWSLPTLAWLVLGGGTLAGLLLPALPVH